MFAMGKENMEFVIEEGNYKYHLWSRAQLQKQQLEYLWVFLLDFVMNTSVYKLTNYLFLLPFPISLPPNIKMLTLANIVC